MMTTFDTSSLSSTMSTTSTAAAAVAATTTTTTNSHHLNAINNNNNHSNHFSNNNNNNNNNNHSHLHHQHHHHDQYANELISAASSAASATTNLMKNNNNSSNNSNNNNNSQQLSSSNSSSNLSSSNDDNSMSSLNNLSSSTTAVTTATTTNGQYCNGIVTANNNNNNSNNNSILNNNHQQQQFDSQQFVRIIQECRNRLSHKQKNLEQLSNRLHGQHGKAQQEIDNTYQAIFTALSKGKTELLKELEDVYNARLISLTIFTSKIDEQLRKIEQMLYYLEQGQDCTNEMINCKSLIDSKLQALLNIDLDSSYHSGELEFIANYNGIQTILKQNIGTIKTSSTADNSGKYLSRSNNNNNNYHHHHHQQHLNNSNNNNNNNNNNSQMNGFVDPSSNGLVDRFGSFNISQNHCTNNNNRSLSSSISDSLNNPFTYDKWSAVGCMNGNGLTSGSGGGTGSNSSPDSTLFTGWNVTDGLVDLTGSDTIDLINNHDSSLSSIATSNMPIKSQVQRQKMIYHCKFGEFGIMEGQFTEPSGVAVNAQNDIIVADTNNHRIQIFDKDGRFKFQFGECGKRDGQLLYPNRVAVVKQSGDIIVTERSPTHQIQVYNQYGQFVRKFGADILQHPRGVTVDNKGNIIIVECKVMRVIIFDLMGNVMHKFGCSKHLEFPNGVVVNDNKEIFISDNRAHCVKVFSYTGTFLRNIGGEGLTNYPIGVCINDSGEILVADNHNNFNITIFTQDGQLVNALESKVKHSQCFDVALMDDNSVVLASKDYRIYIYRYLQLQSLATAVATSGIC